MISKLAFLPTALLIVCGSANAGMNCQDPAVSPNGVEYPRRLLSNNAMQDLFLYAAVAADSRNGNNVFLDKIVNRMKSPDVQNISDAFEVNPAFNALFNHAAIQPGIKARKAPCVPSEWTTYGPTLFYHQAVKAMGDQSSDNNIYGSQVVYKYGSLVTAFNSAVQGATPQRRQIVETCMINSGWNQFIHSNPHAPANALIQAVKSGNQQRISNQKSAFKVSALSADRMASRAAACAVN